MLFFFSSRRRHTRLVSDWSSDVCSSDLHQQPEPSTDDSVLRSRARSAIAHRRRQEGSPPTERRRRTGERTTLWNRRSEERRVGKECRSRWSTYQSNKKAGKKRSHQQQQT